MSIMLGNTNNINWINIETAIALPVTVRLLDIGESVGGIYS